MSYESLFGRNPEEISPSQGPENLIFAPALDSVSRYPFPHPACNWPKGSRQLSSVYLHLLLAVALLALHVLIISRYVPMFALAFWIFSFRSWTGQMHSVCRRVEQRIHCLASGQWSVDRLEHGTGLLLVGCGPENKTGSVPPQPVRKQIHDICLCGQRDARSLYSLKGVLLFINLI